MNIIDAITVNEQSSIRIAAGKTIYFDPYHISGTPHDADIIFITHEHYDHFSPGDISKLANDGTHFVAPKSMARSISALKIPSDKLTLVSPGESISVCGIVAEAVAAYNTKKPFHPKGNGWVGYVVTIDGERIYICGDTDDTPDARAVKCDIVCVPIGGTFTMDAAAAAAFVNGLKPKAAIPVHFGTAVGSPADADRFEAAVLPEISVIRKIIL